MAMTVVVTGKIYNGMIYEYETKDGDVRKLYRGRLNYRDRTNGEWYWIDAVCWKDFGDNDGLVGFLGEHFSADKGPKETGGQPIEIVGFIRPKEGKFTGKFKAKVGGKIKEMEVPNMSHPTYELVIETVDFPPSTEKFSKSDDTSVEFDEAIGDDFEIVTDDEVLEENNDELPPEDEIVVESEEKPVKKNVQKKAPSKNVVKKETVPPSEDDDFFE